jgi:putative NIF3 family GTP cyclohydrolase 1 type 2
LRSRGGIRVVGDPGISVRRVGLLAGTTPIQAALKMLPDVDAIVAGEVREWESVEYARDKVFAGEKKGLILVGRVVSEEPGMDVCATWLKTFISEVPIRHISAGDPYWRPS